METCDHTLSLCLAGTYIGSPCGSAGKESACNVGDLGLIPGLGRSPGEGKGNPLQYSGLENSMHFPHIGIHNYYAYTTGSILDKETLM